MRHGGISKLSVPPSTTAQQGVGLVSHDLPNHGLQPCHIVYDQFTVVLADDPGLRQIVVLPGHGLAVRADLAGLLKSGHQMKTGLGGSTSGPAKVWH